MNPYVAEGQDVTLRPTVFCFLDALGYSEFSRAHDAALVDRFRGYHAALTRGSTILKAPERQQWVRPMWGVDDAAVTAFTDNICIGFPIHLRDDGEIELGELLRRIQARAMGIQVQGYRPRDRDREAAGLPHGRAQLEHRLRMAATVVRTLIADPEAQQRLIAHAAARAGLARDGTRADWVRPDRARDRHR